MKKLKSLLAKIKASVTLKTYQKPLMITILTLLGINFIIILIASFIALLIDKDKSIYGGSFFNAFAQSLVWMITPNSITKTIETNNIGMVILAALVIAIEMILFSGAIVATLTTALRAFVDKKSQAKGAIVIENHFVILNWNSKVPDMIYNLIEKNYKGNVLILSNRNKEYIEGEVQSVISANSGNKKSKIKLIIKEGNPLLHGTLKDISIDKASNICIMSREDMTDGDDDNILNSDLYSLKIVLALGNFNISDECNVVVETDEDEIRQQIYKLSKSINSLKTKAIIPVSFNRKLGQIIAQTIVNPEMADVYLSLFSYSGSEFYSYDSKYTIDEFLAHHNNAIPIVKLGKLFVLAEDNKDISLERSKPLAITRRLKVNEQPEDQKYTAFVIGENKKSRYIIENLKLAADDITTAFSMKTFEKNDTKGLIKEISNTDGYRKVLILSDDSVGMDSYDANVFVSLIALQNAFPQREGLSFVTELLDSRNLQSVRDFNIKNAIISNKLISLLITQLALNKYSKRFFDNLLTIDSEEGGDCFDIKCRVVSEMLDESESLTFKSKAELVQSFYYSFDKKYMLLGYEHDDELIFIPKNMDENKPITLDKEDKLIYISY